MIMERTWKTFCASADCKGIRQMMASNATKDVWVKRSGTRFVILEDIMGKYHVSLRLKKKTSYQMRPKIFFYFTFTHHSGDYERVQ